MHKLFIVRILPGMAEAGRFDSKSFPRSQVVLGNALPSLVPKLSLGTPLLGKLSFPVTSAKDHFPLCLSASLCLSLCVSALNLRSLRPHHAPSAACAHHPPPTTANRKTFSRSLRARLRSIPCRPIRSFCAVRVSMQRTAGKLLRQWGIVCGSAGAPVLYPGESVFADAINGNQRLTQRLPFTEAGGIPGHNVAGRCHLLADGPADEPTRSGKRRAIERGEYVAD